MPKLSDYVALAATEYLKETSQTELNAHWCAEFYQDSGLLDEFPDQNLIDFHNSVQKFLLREAERRSKAQAKK